MLEYIEQYDSTEGKSRAIKKATTEDTAVKTVDFAKKSEKTYISQKRFSSLFVYLEFVGFQTAVAGIIVVFGTTIPGLVQELLMLTVCLASVVNPIVYAVRNRRFRRTLKTIIELQFSTVAGRPALRISVRPEQAQTTR